MKSAVRAAVFAIGMLAKACSAFAGGHIEQLILYKNAQVPLEGNPSESWRPWSNAYTSQSVFMPFDTLREVRAEAREAWLLVVMQANSPSAYVGAGMFVCPALSDAINTDLMNTCPKSGWFFMNDQAPATYTPGCLGTGPGPHPCWIDFTDTFNRLIAAGQPLFLTLGTFGNGSNGPNVYDVELQIVWE
jgi:hypothetical protein